MELRHLRHFVAVAENLHFGRATNRLHTSQSSLSQQVRNLADGMEVFSHTSSCFGPPGRRPRTFNTPTADSRQGETNSGQGTTVLAAAPVGFAEATREGWRVREMVADQLGSAAPIEAPKTEKVKNAKLCHVLFAFAGGARQRRGDGGSASKEWLDLA